MVLVTKKQKTPPIHHRKRHANHHKRGKDYDKHYWPFLPLLSIIGFGFLLNILWAPLSQSFHGKQVLGYSTGTSLASLLVDTNLERTENGLQDLQPNGQLNAAAQAKANDMAKRDYWSHVTPDGVQPWSFAANAGYSYTAIGENLAYGFDDSASTVSGWMNSPEHRENLLNGKYQDVGFGVANAQNYQGKRQQTIVVALYGKSDGLSVDATVRPPTEQSDIAQAAAGSEPIDVSFQVNQPNPAQVVRLQTVASTVPAWSVLSVLLAAAIAAAVFIFRHGRQLHQAIISKRQYILRHTAFDLTVVAVIVISVLLTRTAGFIH